MVDCSGALNFIRGDFYSSINTYLWVAESCRNDSPSVYRRLTPPSKVCTGNAYDCKDISIGVMCIAEFFNQSCEYYNTRGTISYLKEGDIGHRGVICGKEIVY